MTSTPASSPETSAAASTADKPPSPQAGTVSLAAVKPPLRPHETLPPQAFELARLTPEHVGEELSQLLGFVDVSVDYLQPSNMLEALDAIQHARHHHATFHLRSLADALQSLNRRPALRQVLKPGWQPQPPAPMTTTQGVDTALARCIANEVDTPQGVANLDFAWENDAELERHVNAIVKTHGMSPLALSAEAFRLGLADHGKIMGLIASETRDRDALEENYFRRRERCAVAVAIV